MRILVFGGTFNPVHVGHVEMLKKAQVVISPDLTLVIPTFLPPHKSVSSDFLSSVVRLNMCKLAFDEFENTEVSDIEIKAKEKSYSVITFSKLHEIYPDAEFIMLCGADMFLTLQTWYKYDELIKLTAFCALPRKEGADELMEYAKIIENDGGKCIVIDEEVTDISSTEIRQKLFNNEDVSQFVPDKVCEYIENNNLFR
ncbi:MAG: nicotinate (nicotinamide) nucleotide adenylyltransferase [Clostridia bacterium]|nr:nicotinate (nicotinamide) nucleotide adenylyltransferase [Clostridia bacterium]